MESEPLVPKLRFPEFRGASEWKQRTLGAEALFFKGRGISKADIDPNGSCPCIRYGELYTRYGEVIDAVYSRTSAPVTELFLSSKNDVIIPASGETKEDIATASCVTLDGVALGGDINVLRTKHNGVCLSYLINGVYRQAIAKVAQGDTVVHLYPSQLAQVSVALPEASEQQKIADCLTSLDELIAAEGRKMEALRAHKKSLLQDLFPCEGETIPRLRFPEFQNVGNWEEKLAGQLFANRIERGEANLPIYSVTMNDGLVLRSSLERKIDDITAPEGNKKVLKQDLVYNMMRMWQGASGVASEDCLVSPAYIVLAPLKGVSSDFYAAYFKLPQTLQLLTMHSRGLTKDRLRLYYEDFRRMPLLAPGEDEQRRIADCLASLDALITAQAKRLDALNLHKQGLMQGLFPTAEAAEE